MIYKNFKEENFDELENPDGSRFQSNLDSRNEDDLIFSDSLKSSQETELKTQANDEFQELDNKEKASEETTTETKEETKDDDSDLVFQEEYQAPQETTKAEELVISEANDNQESIEETQEEVVNA